ncbi:MAG: DUF692 family protein [Polyangiaceae bacterium]
MLTPAVSGVGLGLRWQILDEVLAGLDDPAALAPIELFEIAPENYMRRGGYFPAMLARVAERFPLLSHGLTLSVGGVDPLDGAYLAETRRFLDRFGIEQHSDHLCFCGADGFMTHDLLPLPFTREAARHAASRVKRAREMLGRPVAIENITYYEVPGEREMDEAAFLGEVLEQADCGLLLDVNNVFVNAANHRAYDPVAFLERLPLHRVVSLHVAGHERDLGRVIDTHGASIAPDVIPLVSWVIERTGPLPVVIERDHKIPPFEELMAEAKAVRAAYDRGLAAHAARSNTAPVRASNDSAPLHASNDSVSLRAPNDSAPPRASNDSAPLRASNDSAPLRASLGDLQRSMVALVRAPGGEGVYRTLVRRGLADILRYQLPRTAALLGDRWDEEVTRHLDATLPRSHYLRDAAFEFRARVEPAWRADATVPRCALDTARFELLAFEVRNAPDDPPARDPAPLALDRGALLSTSARVVRFDHAVHLAPEDDDAPVLPPPADPVILLAYRDAEHEMRTLVLTRSAAEILERLARGATLGEAVSAAASAIGASLDPPFLQGAAAFLEDLVTRGAIRGAA